MSTLSQLTAAEDLAAAGNLVAAGAQIAVHRLLLSYLVPVSLLCSRCCFPLLGGLQVPLWHEPDLYLFL